MDNIFYNKVKKIEFKWMYLLVFHCNIQMTFCEKKTFVLANKIIYC